MHEPQLNAASAKAKPDEVMLRDVLKPSSLIIALIASVLFILLGWYFFVLKPALSENNPMDIRLTKKPSFNMPYSKELKTNTEIEPQLTQDDFVPFIVGKYPLGKMPNVDKIIMISKMMKSTRTI